MHIQYAFSATKGGMNEIACCERIIRSVRQVGRDVPDRPLNTFCLAFDRRAGTSRRTRHGPWQREDVSTINAKNSKKLSQNAYGLTEHHGQAVQARVACVSKR